MKPFAKTKRPLGPLDRRRNVYRCKQCRLSHRKCDEHRPCSACRIRKLQCPSITEPEKAAEKCIVVLNTPRSPGDQAIEAQHKPCQSPNLQPEDNIDLIDEFLVFVEARDAARQLPIPFQALRSPLISHFLATDEAFRLAACTIGAAFREQHDNIPVAGSLLVFTQQAFSQASGLLQTVLAAKSKPQLSSVLCALFLAIYLLTVDETATKIISWTEQVFRPLFYRYGQDEVFDGPTKPFLRLFWIFDTIFASEYDQDTALADPDWQSKLNPFRKLPNEIKYTNLEEITDRVLQLFARLVRLNALTVSFWFKERSGTSYPTLSQPSQDPHTKDTDPPNLEIASRLEEIEAIYRNFHHLREVLIQKEPDLADEHNSNSSTIGSQTIKDARTVLFLNIYMNISILSLLRLLDDNVLNHASTTNHTITLDTTKEVLGSVMKDGQGDRRNLILECFALLDTNTEPIDIDCMLYFPALTTLALEVRCTELRRRLEDLFILLNTKGLVVASGALVDMKMAWAATAPGCGDLCLCT